MNKSKRLWVDSFVNFLKENQRTPGWVATKSGVTRSQVGRIISGGSEPTLETMNRISRALGIETAEWFVSRDIDAPLTVDKQSGKPTLSPSAIPGPLSASDAAVILAQLSSIEPDRRAAALAIIFDDDSLAPDLEDSSSLAKPG